MDWFHFGAFIWPNEGCAILLLKHIGFGVISVKQPGKRLISPKGVFGGLLIVLVGMAVWLYFDLANSYRQITSSRIELAQQQSQFMSQWLGTAILATDYVLRDINEKVPPETLALMKSSRKRVEEISAWLEKKRTTVPNVTGISLFGKDCVFESAADPRLIGFRSNQRACRDRSVAVEDKMYLQYVSAEKSANKKPSVLVSRYNISPKGEILGGVLAAIDLTYAEDWITSFRVAKNDVLAVVDGDGVLLARNPELAGQIGLKWPLPADSFPLRETRSSGFFEAVSPLDGRDRFFGISKMENIPIIVIVGFDKEDALNEWSRRSMQLAVGYVALFALSMIVFWSFLSILRQRDEMGRLATTDPLTGISNRRALMNAGEREFDRQSRYQNRLSVLMIDIDRFKNINDTLGHPTGDKVIRCVAEIMMSSVRTQDVVGRVGGEEFVVLLPETDLEGATVIAERLRSTAENTDVPDENGKVVKFTISIGVATNGCEDDSFEHLLGRADKGLYAAKESGRNRVVAE